MNAPADQAAQPASQRRNLGRQIVVSLVLSVLVCLVLLSMAFSFVTSLLIGAGICVLIMAASALSSVVEIAVEAIATIVFGILAVIGAILAGIFSIFG